MGTIRSCIVALCAVLMCAGTGCDQLMYGFSRYPRSPRYSVGFYNAIGEDLSGVHADWTARGEAYRMRAGLMGVESSATDSEAPDPIPDKATLFWTTADGRAHQQTVKVADIIPKIASFTGTIWFKITKTGIGVFPQTEKQMNDFAAQQKPYPYLP